MLFRILSVSILSFLVGVTLFTPPHGVMESARDNPIRLLVAILVGLLAAWRFRIPQQAWRRMLGLSNRAFLWSLFFVSFAAGILVSWVVFDRLPGTADADAMYFQARIFAAGKITTFAPPHGHFYLYGLLGPETGHSHWCGMYPPGWPALWIPFVYPGTPWLANPLYSALLCVTVVLLGREMFSEATARFGGVLALSSPLLLLISGTWYSHPSAALFGVLAAWGTLRLLKTGRFRYGVVAGCCMGFTFLIRPPTAFAIGLCITLVPLVHWRIALRHWKPVLLAGGIAVALMALLPAFYHVTTGNAFTAGHNFFLSGDQDLGFSEHYTLADAWNNTFTRIQVANERNFGGPIPLMLLILPAFIIGRKPERSWWRLWCLLPFLALTMVILMLSYYEKYYPGRYLLEAMPWLCLLAAESMLSLSRRLRYGVMACSLCFSVGTAWPGLLGSYHDQFKDADPDLEKLEKQYSLQNAVVLMQHGHKNKWATGNGVYEYGFRRNALTLTNNVVYTRNRHPRVGHGGNGALYKLYSGRNFYWFLYYPESRQYDFFRVIPHPKNDFLSNHFRLSPTLPESPHPWSYQWPLQEVEFPAGEGTLCVSGMIKCTNDVPYKIHIGDRILVEGTSSTDMYSPANLFQFQVEHPETGMIKIDGSGMVEVLTGRLGPQGEMAVGGAFDICLQQFGPLTVRANRWTVPVTGASTLAVPTGKELELRLHSDSDGTRLRVGDQTLSLKSGRQKVRVKLASGFDRNIPLSTQEGVPPVYFESAKWK